MVLLRVRSKEGHFRVTVKNDDNVQQEIGRALKITSSFKLYLDKTKQTVFSESTRLM